MLMDSLAAHVLDLAWLPVAFVLLGAALATALVTRLRLPAWFWLPLVFGGTSLVSYVLFYVWFFDASIGRTASRWTLVIAAIAFAWQCTRRGVQRLLRDRDAWLPGALMALALITYACLLAWPQVSANYRFRIPLPPEDNDAPRVLADRIDWRLYQHGMPPPIMDHGYRSSDRPPLQSGIALALRPWEVSYNSWSYQIIGLICQLGWIPALYALTRTIGLTRRQIAAVLIACACSGFFFLNSIFTWPKLLAATLFLSALALLLWLIRVTHAAAERRATDFRRRVLRQPERSQREVSQPELSHAGLSQRELPEPGFSLPEPLPQTGPALRLSAVLMVLALLAHGGPLFSIIALPVLLLPLRPWPRVRPRDLVIGALLGVALLAPWLAYQRFYDPPGDRLWKIHFAGLPQDDFSDTRPFLQALREEYGKLTPGEYLAGRWSNVKEQFLVFGKAPPNGPVYWVQWQQFIHHLPALDFLLIGFLAWLMPANRRRPDTPSRMLRGLTAYAFIALIIWLVLLLAPQSALMHHGSYATTAVLFLCATAWLTTLPAAIAWSALLLHVLLFAWAWTAWPNQPPPAPASGNPLYLVVAAVGLIAFAIGVFRLVPESTSDADVAADAMGDYASRRTYSKSTGSRLTPLDGGAM